MRALPNMVILSPCDAEETCQMLWWMAEYQGPVYLRLNRSRVLNIHAPEYHFQVGKSECVRSGKDVTVFVTGDLVTLALELHDQLQIEGIEAQVINIATLKPITPDQVIVHGEKTCAAITIEDHNIIGGLGSAIAEIYAEHLQKPLRRIGIPDTFTESDDKEVLLDAYGVSVKNATSIVRDLLGRILKRSETC